MLVNNLLIRDTFDATAQVYINAVETADGQALEAEVARAITRFVKGCKKDGTWTAIKACCILAGARTLTGALVPLVGAAPTNINFVSGDYNRKTGLLGNGTSKYINSNRANNIDPQNSNHHAIYVSTAGGDGAYAGAGGTSSGANNLVTNPSGSRFQFRNRSTTANQVTGAQSATGFIGTSRSASANYTARINSANTIFSVASQSPTTDNVFVFCRSNGATPNAYTSPRLAFYSIGESLDLALLDARVSVLMTAFNRYIP